MAKNHELLHRGSRPDQEEEDYAMLALPADVLQIAMESPYCRYRLHSCWKSYQHRRQLGMTHEEAREKLRARIQKANGEAAFMTYGPDHPQAIFDIKEIKL